MANNVPADAPPMFIAVASDDGFQLTPQSVNLYQQWLNTKHSAELHIYSTGNHGFRHACAASSSDTWIDRFGDWLRLNGYLKMLHPPDWMKNVADWQLDEWKKDEERFPQRLAESWPLQDANTNSPFNNFNKAAGSIHG